MALENFRRFFLAVAFGRREEGSRFNRHFSVFFLNGKPMKYSLAHHKVQLTTINCAVMHTQSLLRLAQLRFKSTVSLRLFLSQKFANCKIKARSLE